MKLMWLAALLLVLVLAWCGGVAAGPTRPAGGDPDIFDLAKPRVNGSATYVGESNFSSVTVNIMIFGRYQRVQERSDTGKAMRPRLAVNPDAVRTR